MFFIYYSFKDSTLKVLQILRFITEPDTFSKNHSFFCLVHFIAYYII